MKLYLFGFGKMGKSVARIAEGRNHQIVSSIQDAEACIDFSVSEAVLEHVEEVCRAQLPIVIGTTGWEKDLPVVQRLVEKSGNAALYAPNFSIGIALFRKLLLEARRLFADFEIAGLEIHHSEKKDAPSGTAAAIAKDLGISSFSSLRVGSIVGRHEVLFDSFQETITIRHEAKNRDGFALGAVQTAEWIIDQKGWLTLDDMLYSTHYAIR
ncbi:MAG: hypothetical protein JJU12_06950 [Chlamydiales bacterium]|nr:hypothetical protein [Chlamydiales bacterium]